MIVLDTNVISEVIRPSPDPRVAKWMRAQPRRSLVTCTMVQAEILYGFAIMAEGKRREALQSLAQAIFGRLQPILPFTGEAARHYADICAERRLIGRPIATLDALIAATAKAAGAAIASRDVNGFSDCGLTVINPWGDHQPGSRQSGT